MSAASSYPSAGTVIDGKYRIDRVLGEGGMGAVMAAYHVMLKAPVALKFISPDVLRVPGAVERFINEGVAARGIQSDHVVRIDDVGVLPDSGLPYIVMEMLQGCDLSELLASEAPRGLPIGRAVHFVLQILRGLQAAHARGVIHRDLKPSNAYVITRDGEPDFVKLLDFGISKLAAEAGQEAQALTQTNTGLGTPLYMSPEQARNAREADARSDLYSVSAILYELLTGRTPYLAETPNDLLYKLFTAEPDPIAVLRDDLPPGLVRLIHQGLSKNPAQRPSSASEYAELLSPFADARSAEIITRLRAAAGGVPASSLLLEGRAASLLPGRPGSLPDRPDLGPEVMGQTAVSPGGLTPGGASLSTPPPAPSLPLSAKIALAVGVLAIAAGSAVLLRTTKDPAPTPPPVAATSAPIATEPPSATPPTSTLQVVIPVPSAASATPVASSARPIVGVAPVKGPGPARPPGDGKKNPNPFGATIVQ